MIHRVHIDRLVLRGTGLNPIHAERLRELVGAELARELDGSEAGRLSGRIPHGDQPEQLAGPIAREIAARIRSNPPS